MARKKKTPKTTNVNDNNNKTATTNKTLITPTVNTHQTCLPTLVHTPKQDCVESNESNKSNGFIQHNKDIQGDVKDACNNAIVVVAVQERNQNQNQNNCNCKPVDDSDDQMPEIKTLKYQSDSELMDLKNYEKNKSNLFLIKSYSFIDKTNNKRKTQQQYGGGGGGGVKPPKLKEIKFNDKFTKNISSMDVKNFKNTEQEKIVKPCEKPEKPKKPPKLKKMKKAKSTHNSTENLHELQQLLRRPTPPPSIVLHDTENAKRPLSLPPATANHNHKPVAKAKTLDDIETPRLKRDSFLRHSLQSIRRSFSSAKKSTNPSHISCSSNSSSSSSSNCSSVSVPNRKSFKTKDQLKDVANLSEIEEDANYLIAVKEEDDQVNCTAININTNTSTSEPCKVITNLNNGNGNTNDKPIDNTSTSHLSRLSPPASALLHSTMDSSSLAVLKEEDEKDFIHNPTHPPCVINEQRSTSSVSTLAQLPTDSLSPMAPLQTHTECQSVQCLNIIDKDYKSSSSSSTTTTGSSSSPPQQQKAKRAPFQHQLSIPESLQSTSIGCVTSSEYSSARSLKHSATSLTPLQTLNSSSSLRSISPLRRSASSNSSSTAKHEQSTAAATAAAAATATTSNGTSATSASTATPPEKEKKRKEISSSRVKKFHRHFAQVSKDEKLINYFSCALVSDILLQGHLYITDHHFAFYSNVFGYVTKVVIPTSSVTKISKEKTAKIIPNAVGVATADERHVFGSFISREAAFRLMCSVCPPLGVPEILPKDPASIEISEEYSIEDDSSCSISGNESPAQAIELLNSSSNNTNGNLHNDASQTILRRSVGSSNLSIADATAATTADKLRHSDIPINAKKATNTASSRSSAPPSTVAAHFANGSSNGDAAGGGGGGVVNLVGLKTMLTPTQEDSGDASKLTIIAGCASTSTSATSTPTPSSASMPTTVMTLPSSKAKHVINIFRNVSQKLMTHVKFPTEIHVVYLGVMLTLLLALFSIFLLYRILDIEAKTNGYRSPIEFNWRSGNDDDIFTEALRFQKQLQLKSTEEAQNILKTNLEQIAKVRRSLETLSMLIHDRSSSFVSTNTDDSD